MLRYEHGGDIYAHKRIRLDFSVNLNPAGMPAPVREALIANVKDFSRYPDPQCRRLRSRLAEYEDMDEDGILCGNGAADLIFRLCLALKPQTALIVSPTFSEYEKAVLQAGGRPVYHALAPEEGFALTPRILADLRSGPDMLFLCNPNNPTGLLIEEGLLDQIAGLCLERGIILILDECFLDFTRGRSLKALLPANPQVVLLKAFTKMYAMAGLRLGYLLSANRELLRKTGNFGQSWSVSAPAQTAGIAALDCWGWVAGSRLLVEAERVYLQTELRALGLDVLPSDANFFLIHSREALYEGLLAKNILIRRCDNFPGLGPDYFRVGVKTNDDNQKLVKALKEVLTHG